MEIDDVIVFEDLVKPYVLMVNKDVEKKIRPLVRGSDGRQPEKQLLNGCPGFQFHDDVIFFIKCGDKGLRMTYGKTGIYFYFDWPFFHMDFETAPNAPNIDLYHVLIISTP